MRKTIILGLILTLTGFVAVAQASDRSEPPGRDSAQVQHRASNDRGGQHDRYERRNRARERHHDSYERRYESRDMHKDFDERHHRR